MSATHSEYSAHSAQAALSSMTARNSLMPWKSFSLNCLLLGMLVTAVYCLVGSYPLVSLDDPENTIANPHLQGNGNLTAIWTGSYRNMYAPVSYSLWWVLSRAFDISSPAFSAAAHITNMLLHWVAACASFALLLRLSGPRGRGAFLGAALVAVHPVAVEAVAWVSGLRDVLSMSLSMLALLALTIAGERPSSDLHSNLFRLAGLAAGILAMLAKPSAIVLPLMLLAWWAVLGRRWKSVLPEFCVLLTQASVVALTAASVQKATEVPPIASWARPIVAADSLVWYAAQIISPRVLTIDHGRLPQLVITPAHVILATAILALLTIVGLLWRRIGWAMLLSAVTLLPVLGFITFDFQRHSTVADRYAYPALFGVGVIACLLANSGCTMRLALSAWACLLGVKAHATTRFWQSSESLYTRALVHTPGSILAGNGLALMTAADAHPGDENSVTAERLFNTVLSYRPGDPLTHANYGQFLLRQSRAAEARKHLEIAATAYPDQPSVLNGLGMSLAMTGELNGAAAALARAAELAPTNVETLLNLSLVERARGNRARSRELAERAALLLNESDPRAATANELRK